MSGIPTVFLDCDGVLNRAVIRNGRPYPPRTLDELQLVPGIVHSLNLLVSGGYILIGVTNQPDVARGTQTRPAVEALQTYLLDHLPLKEFFTCYHDDQDHCPCRKPKPGLILQGAEKYGSDLSKSWMVGDRWKDISAGKAAGLRTVFVNYCYDETYIGPLADFTIMDVSNLAEVILNL